MLLGLNNFRFADWKTRKKKFVQYEVQYESPRLFIYFQYCPGATLRTNY